MTFDEFYRLALTVDENAYVYEDSDGLLNIGTNYFTIGDNESPLGYQEVP